MKIKLIFIILFCCFLSQNYCWSQTSQGRWTVGGHFHSDLFVIDNTHEKRFSIQGKLGYVFFDRWLASGQFDANFIGDDLLLRQRLNVRYSFISKYPVEIYAGLDYEYVDERVNYSNTQSLRQIDVLVGPLMGIHHFLNPNTALDLQVRIPIFHYYKRGIDYTEKINGFLNANFTLRFFFGGHHQSDTTNRVYEPSQRKWLIGGSLLAGQGNLEFESELTWLNDLSPYAGYIFNKRIMLGLRFHFLNNREVDRINFGLSPFVRYYFLQKRNHHFYLDQHFGLSFSEDVPKQFSDMTDAYTGLGFGIGWSRFITPKVCLDLQGGLKWIHNENGNSRYVFVGDFNSRFYFQIGLESYL